MPESFSVYLVEDHPALQETLCSSFRELGASICGVADDAPQVIREILRSNPDVIVLDLRLRSSTGLDVLSGIGHPRSSPCCGLRIMFSNVCDQFRRDKAAELGAGHYFDKMEGYGFLLQAITDHVAKLSRKDHHRRGRTCGVLIDGVPPRYGVY